MASGADRCDRSRPSSTTVDAIAFYRLVADARPDDVLLRVGVGDPADASPVADALAASCGATTSSSSGPTDRARCSSAEATTPSRALEQRFRAQLPHLADQVTTTVAGTDPIDAFTRLTSD